jgi:hypothetical protein
LKIESRSNKYKYIAVLAGKTLFIQKKSIAHQIIHKINNVYPLLSLKNLTTVKACPQN